ncbi:MAG: hypothetical protein ACMXYM_02210 [Candidatus Woesearchaeota archaeon]
MGSMIEINDTLQLTHEQGFPRELDYKQHMGTPFRASDFEEPFEFKDKPGVRLYQRPPIRNFLVQNVDGKWIYWGLVHVLEVVHDMVQQTTSGTFRIIHLYSPEEMKLAHELIDRNEATAFFR